MEYDGYREPEKYFAMKQHYKRTEKPEYGL